MTLEKMNLEDGLEMEVEDILSSITADLLEFESNRLFLDRLFSEEAGKWLEIAPLCEGLVEIESQLEELRASFEGRLRVIWLDYPDAAAGEGYCLIVFFVEELMWSNLSIYNQKYFFRN